jgi:hypothetical protein
MAASVGGAIQINHHTVGVTSNGFGDAISSKATNKQWGSRGITLQHFCDFGSEHCHFAQK